MKPRAIPAGQFKSKCLALLDEVARSGRPLVVTKRRKPVARVVPVEDARPIDLLGSVTFEGDLLAPVDEPWDADR